MIGPAIEIRRRGPRPLGTDLPEVAWTHLWPTLRYRELDADFSEGGLAYTQPLKQLARAPHTKQLNEVLLWTQSSANIWAVEAQGIAHALHPAYWAIRRLTR